MVRRFQNRRFYQILFDEGYPGSIVVDSYGDMNRDLEIFLINIEADKVGLPCYIRYTLLALYEIKKLNFTPVIKYTDKSNWLQENSKINGTDNIFEYYYLQPGVVSLNQVQKSHHVYTCKSSSMLMRANMDLGCYEENGLLAPYEVTEEYIDIMSAIYRDYFCFNKITEDVLQQSFDTLFGKCDLNKIMGVHIRGTDFAMNYLKHPKKVTTKEFEEAIDDLFYKGNFSWIFLATDDSEKLMYFKKKYPGKILYYNDVYRSNGKKNIMSVGENRPGDKYKKGLEVMRDVYALSLCNGLVAGLSHVSILARIIKKSRNESFMFQTILSNGIN